VQIESMQVEEFRLRLGHCPSALYTGREHPLCERTATQQDICRCLEKATNASVHAFSDSLRNGYVCYKGLRVGVCGTASVQNGQIKGFRSYCSVAVRIPREHRGVCDGVYGQLYSKGFQNTLIIAPPGGGKTTALRELIRKLSNDGFRCAVCDERNEIGAYDMGQARFSLGRCTDVLSGVDKAQAAIMLLRGMNPEIVAMDEITRAEDIDAICDLFGCGVGLLASAHAAGLEDMRRRKLYGTLLEIGVFSQLLIISGKGADRQYELKRICT